MLIVDKIASSLCSLLWICLNWYITYPLNQDCYHFLFRLHVWVCTYSLQFFNQSITKRLPLNQTLHFLFYFFSQGTYHIHLVIFFFFSSTIFPLFHSVLPYCFIFYILFFFPSIYHFHLIFHSFIFSTLTQEFIPLHFRF